MGSLENENGQVISDSEEKVEKLNDFFCSVFTKESNSDMPVPDTCFAGNNNNDKLEDILITPEMISGKLQHLKLDKAAGNDNLFPRLFKSISSEIALPIAMISEICRYWSCSTRLENGKHNAIVQEKEKIAS